MSASMHSRVVLVFLPYLITAVLGVSHPPSAGEASSRPRLSEFFTAEDSDRDSRDSRPDSAVSSDSRRESEVSGLPDEESSDEDDEDEAPFSFLRCLFEAWMANDGGWVPKGPQTEDHRTKERFLIRRLPGRRQTIPPTGFGDRW